MTTPALRIIKELEAERDEWRQAARAEAELADGFKAQRDALLPVVRYAANMPDSRTMPIWAEELRYRARAALSRLENDR